LQSFLDVFVDVELRREDMPHNALSINDIGHCKELTYCSCGIIR